MRFFLCMHYRKAQLLLSATPVADQQQPPVYDNPRQMHACSKSFRLCVFKLFLVEAMIHSFLSHEFCMVSFLYDFSFVDNYDVVCVPNGGKSMGNNE